MALHLLDGEKILWSSFPGRRYRMIIFTRDIIFTAFVAILLSKGLEALLPMLSSSILMKLGFVVGALGVAFSLVNQMNLLLVRYYITSERVIIMRGFLSKKLDSVKLGHVVDTKVDQTFSERMINTGTVYVYATNDINNFDSEKDPLNLVPALKNIDNPFEVHRLLESVLKD